MQQRVIQEKSSSLISLSLIITIMQVDKVWMSVSGLDHQGSGVTGVLVGEGGDDYFGVDLSVGVSIGIDAASRSIDRYLTPVTPFPNLTTVRSTAAFFISTRSEWIGLIRYPRPDDCQITFNPTVLFLKSDSA